MLLIADLKKYFIPAASGSSSTQSILDTNEDLTEQGKDSIEVEVEENVEVEVEENLEVEVEENLEVEVEGAEGITDFINHIKFDPGLRIPIDRFAPNVREDVRFLI